MSKVVKLNKDYAAKVTPHGVAVFAYLEQEGEIKKDPYPSRVTLRDPAIANLAIHFLKLGQMLDEAIGLYLEFQDVHGYTPERARAAAVQEILDGLGELEAIQEWHERELKED